MARLLCCEGAGLRGAEDARSLGPCAKMRDFLVAKKCDRRFVMRAKQI